MLKCISISIHNYECAVDGSNAMAGFEGFVYYILVYCFMCILRLMEIF